MTEVRLVEMETRLAYQDQLVEELNKLVYEQDKRIQRLEQTCKRLGKQFTDLYGDSPAVENDEQPPPNY